MLAHCRDDRLPAVGAVDDQLFVGVSVGGADFRLLVQRPTNGDGLTDDLVGALQRRQGLLNKYDLTSSNKLLCSGRRLAAQR